MDLAGSERAAPVGALDLGRSPPDEPVDLTLLLRRRSDQGPYPTLPGPPIDREEFAARYGLAPSDLAAVRAFAASAHLAETGVAIGPRRVQLRGTVATVEAAFATELHRWSGPEGTFRARSGPLGVPASLAGIVLGVFGADTRPQARPHFRWHPDPGPGDVAFAPTEVAAAYDFPAGATGAGATLGFVELGGGFTPQGLATYFGGLGLAPPAVAVVGVDGAQNAPGQSVDGPDGEVQLDLEVAGACAPGASLVAYFAPNTDQGFLDALTTAVHDTTHRPTIVSISWGSPEDQWTAQARSALNDACQDAAALGVTVLVAAGDQGADDGGPPGSLHVDFPASSPYALACGGTRLTLAPTRQEVVWNEEALGEGATGGGVSVEFARPDYQASAGVPPGPGGFVGRGVPDVAGNADPTTGYRVVVDGQSTVLGGTSAVAPLWAALLARCTEALGRPVGFVHPSLYAAAARAAFRDIVRGNNDGYSAGPGWDPCTGWGSPIGTALLTMLRGAAASGAGPAAPPPAP